MPPSSFFLPRVAPFITSLIAPFQTTKGISARLLFLFIGVNSLVLLNVILHAPDANYDGKEHFRYIETIANGRLPNFEDSEEFFSPPLPYLLPAQVLQAESSSMWAAAKWGQVLNVILSIGVTYTLLKICNLLHPGDEGLKLAALGMLGILPVYYKTFSMARGEPFVAFFSILGTCLVLYLFLSNSAVPPLKSRRRILIGIILGVCLGLGVLSRQWGFFLFPALAVFVLLLKLKIPWSQWLPSSGILILSFVIAFVVGGWFYLSLLERYGTVAAFNRPSEAAFTLANQPPEFYFSLGLDQLFSHPIRPVFSNQFIPIFYSELWGDYWGYFLIVGRDIRYNQFLVGSFQQPLWEQNPPVKWFVTNKFDVTPYLGRVNFVSLLPSALLLAGFGLGILHLARFLRQKPDPPLTGNTLIILIILASMAGYFWFLVRYPALDKGDTIKASYMLHLYPFLAILSGQVLQKIKTASPLVGRITVLLLFVILLYNLPAMVTRYVPWDRLAYYPPFRWMTAYLPWQ
ncbi:MAG TPA: hypothetical protein VI451_16910 [Anaerolineales bacterium]|nr:hypothetical protein [Anaerolineales bacterium]